MSTLPDRHFYPSHMLCRPQHPGGSHFTEPSPIFRASSNIIPYQNLSLASPSPVSSQYNRAIDMQPEQCQEPQFDELPVQEQHLRQANTFMQLSDFEDCQDIGHELPYQIDTSFCPASTSNGLPSLPGDFSYSHNAAPPPSPYSTTPSIYDDSPLSSPYFSSPEIHPAGVPNYTPRSTPDDEYDLDDDEDDVADAAGSRPYAGLIYEALLQKPGHRMMLREIYKWFEENTNKPYESGSSGWQNSIRHNLSMNKAFENDKAPIVNAKGESKKATSIWFLTEDAIRNGVQSTTRYRKKPEPESRRRGLHRPDSQRQRSGAKGGRAARRAARLRRQQDQLYQATWNPPMAAPNSIGPFNHLVHAANMMNEYAPTDGSQPPSPPECYPFTPNSPEKDYGTDPAQNFGCDMSDPTLIDAQLRDLLLQESYTNPTRTT